MYSQYLNVAKMKLVTDHDFERQRLGQLKFMYAIRGDGEEYIDYIVPDSVKMLVNESNTLGETLMRHTLH